MSAGREPPARVERTGEGGYLLRGDLGFDSAATLWADGLELIGRESSLTMDLGGVSRTDSAGLALLVDWIGEARRRGARMRVRNVPAQLLAIARISRLEELLRDEAPGADPSGGSDSP